ncbi:hypothetical protein ElyMa_003312500 [Elysia marginata]|uniref:Uncharacterized protein n=1 Tax=Elysia marginata TaxID=1093978 RepID=A0AAV4JG63_9GAST|nr:hypothetical protein ElyMa_003312500 [Elysia marginata]
MSKFKQPTNQHRDHTHGFLSGYSHCRLTASQYRSSTTIKTNSTVRQVPASTGFLSHKQGRPSSDRLPGLSSSHRPLTQVTLSAKSKTLCGGETGISLCQSDGVSTYDVPALLGLVSSVCFALFFKGLKNPT